MKDDQIVQKDFIPERVSKVVARAGVASRREVERMIVQKRVKLNGVLLERAAVNVIPTDTIEIDGIPLRKAERTRLWLYHKPAGLVTTHADPDSRSTVFDNLPSISPRVISVGRLDINTEGLLLLTNDGGLSRILELPSTQWLRVYRVRVYGPIDQNKIDLLKNGIVIQGVFYRDMQLEIDSQKGSNSWLTVSLREGKNREIKKIFEFFNWKVNRLIRISYGPFQLGDLSEGDTREVSKKVLCEQLGPNLLKDARVNLDAPVYAHDELINNYPNIKDSCDIKIIEKNNDFKNVFIKKKKLFTPIKRRNLSSNVWMSKGVHTTANDFDQKAVTHRRSSRNIRSPKKSLLHRRSKKI
ncbi:rRNA pseudouridine synthase [Candidatus Liberibacter brunswickensis]